jgi:ribonuclease P protein component
VVVSSVVVGTRGEPPRVAYAVGSRVGGAVVRNRVRRRLRAATRLHAGALEAGHAYLVSTAPAAASSTYDALADSLHGALRALREERA